MHDSPSFSGLLITPETDMPAALIIAQEFSIPLIQEIIDNSFYLDFTNERLSLLQSGKHTPGPISVDFTTGKLAHRLKFGGGRGQPLARATGMKSGFNPVCFDATAGLGRDGFILASLGSSVTLCERSSVLAALLQNGIVRANSDDEIGGWVSKRIHLVHDDSSKFLTSLKDAHQPDVIFIDPMYPEKKGNALVKKEMSALQHLLGPDTDSDILFQIALRSARRRVVIKRPKQASWLNEQKPDTSIESKNTRYDIYVTL